MERFRDIGTEPTGASARPRALVSVFGAAIYFELASFRRGNGLSGKLRLWAPLTVSPAENKALKR